MSVPADLTRRVGLADLLARARQGEPIAMLTCYDACFARLLAAAGIDTLLVGDSAAQVMFGFDSTLPMPIDLAVHLTAAVRRGAPHAWIVADLPFRSLAAGDAVARADATRLVADGGADCVKIETTLGLLDVIQQLAAAGLPVMAHFGLLPQHVRKTGHYKAQARQHEEIQTLARQASAAVEAGAVAILLEAVPQDAGQAVTDAVGQQALVIGCGGGSAVHGQVLVLHDVLGLSPGPLARFAQPFGDLTAAVQAAAGTYAQAVRDRSYPAAKHIYGLALKQSPDLP